MINFHRSSVFFHFTSLLVVLPSEDPERVCTVDDSELLDAIGVAKIVAVGVPGDVGGKTVTAGITDEENDCSPPT